MFATT